MAKTRKWKDIFGHMSTFSGDPRDLVFCKGGASSFGRIINQLSYILCFGINQENENVQCSSK